MPLIINYETTDRGTIRCKCGHEETHERYVWYRCPRCFRRAWFVKKDKKK
jgi:Zn finger protein HypA/HybF involved in hydrogenase expression